MVQKRGLPMCLNNLIKAVVILLILSIGGVSDAEDKNKETELIPFLEPGFFELTSDTFLDKEKEFPGEWVSDDKISYRALNVSSPGRPVPECLFEFNQMTKELEKITAFYYFRVDDKEMPRKEFDNCVDSIKKELQTYSKKPLECKNNQGTTKYDTAQLQKDGIIASLEYDVTNWKNAVRTEYIKIVFTKVPKKSAMSTAPVKGENQAITSSKEANKKVTKEGVVVLIKDIPMIDQGDKGYCAPATVARILQYYGREVDMYDIAKITGSSSEEGTRVSDLIEGLNKYRTRLKISIDAPLLFNSASVETFISEYNKQAKKEKIDTVAVPTEQMHMYDFYEWLSSGQADKELFKKIRIKDSDYKKFIKIIKSNVDKGIPLCWNLTVGIYPEEGKIPQKTFAHYRIIIGHDKENLIFSDCWGKGHEEKRMKFEDAFPATASLVIIRP